MSDLKFKPKEFTDLCQADALIAMSGHSRLRWCDGLGWLVYDGVKWDRNEKAAQELSQRLTRYQRDEAWSEVQRTSKDEDEARKRWMETRSDADRTALEEAKAASSAAWRYYKYAQDRQKSARIAATLKEAAPQLTVKTDDLDSDPFLLNTPGGCVDLRTGAIRENRPQDFCTKSTAVSPGSEGMSVWLEFLDQIAQGDQSLIYFLQLLAGMKAIGKVFSETLEMDYGPGGNGKSTFNGALQSVLGSYAITLSPKILVSDERQNKNSQIALLRGCRACFCAELDQGVSLDVSTVKQLVSTDRVYGEFKYQDGFDFKPAHSVVLSTNFLPRVTAADDGTWDRLLVIPFTARFRNQDGEHKNYADFLFQHCGPAILQWAIDGAKNLIDAEFKLEKFMPECVIEIGKQYQRENDLLRNFIADCCETSHNVSENASSLYIGYKEYCEAIGKPCETMKSFRRLLESRGFFYSRVAAGGRYHGIRLLRDQDGDQDQAIAWDGEIERD